MSGTENIDAVSKTLRLVELMAAHNGELTVTQIARQLDCSISSANRFLQTLEREGLVEKNPHTRRYELTWLLYVLGARLVVNDPSVEKLIPVAHAVSQRFDVSVNINTMLGKEALLLFRVPRFYNKDLDFLSAETAPAYCTSSGKVILSQLDAEQLDAYFDGLQIRSFQKRQLTEEDLRAAAYPAAGLRGMPGGICVRRVQHQLSLPGSVRTSVCPDADRTHAGEKADHPAGTAEGGPADAFAGIKSKGSVPFAQYAPLADVRLQTDSI